MRKLIVCLLLPFAAFGDSCTDSAAQTISNSFVSVASQWSYAIKTAPGISLDTSTYQGRYYSTDSRSDVTPSALGFNSGSGTQYVQSQTIYHASGESSVVEEYYFDTTRNTQGSLVDPVTLGGDGRLSQLLTTQYNSAINSLSGLSCSEGGESGESDCCCAAEINSVVSAVQEASSSIVAAIGNIPSSSTDLSTIESICSNGFTELNTSLTAIFRIIREADNKLDSIETLLETISSNNSGVDFTNIIAAIDGLKNSLALEVTQSSIANTLVSWNQYIRQLDNLSGILSNLQEVNGHLDTIIAELPRPEWIDSDFWPAVTDLISAVSSNGVSDVNMGIVTNIYDSAIGSWSSMSNFWQGVSGREGYGISPSELGIYVAQFFDVSENWDFWGLGSSFWDSFESENYETIKNTFIDGGNTLSAINGGANLLAIYEYAKGYKSASDITNELQSTDETIDEFRADFESQLSQTNQYHFSSSLSNTVFYASDINELVFPSVDGDMDIEFVSPEFAAAVNSGAGQELLNLSDWHIKLNIADFDFRTIFEYVRTIVTWLYRVLISVAFLISIWGLLPALSQFIDKIISRLTKCIDYFEEFIRKLSKF